MSADLRLTGILLSFLSATLRARGTELNQNRPHAQKWVRFENTCPKSGTSQPPTNRGLRNHLFDIFTTLTAYIFGTKHDINKRVSALQKGLLYPLKTTWTLVHKRLQIGSEFSRTLCKFCIPLHCQASQTAISKQDSTKLCQTVECKSR